MRGKAWLLPAGVVVACIPCLLIPVSAALIAGGVFGGVLGLLGIPWVLALIIAVPIAAVFLAVRLRRQPGACDVPQALAAESMHLTTTAAKKPVERH